MRTVSSSRSSKSIAPDASLRRSYSRKTPAIRSSGIGGSWALRAPPEGLRRGRRGAIQAVAVGLRGEPPVLGPLDLGREVAGRTEAIRRRQRVPDLTQQ